MSADPTAVPCVGDAKCVGTHGTSLDYSSDTTESASGTKITWAADFMLICTLCDKELESRYLHDLPCRHLLCQECLINKVEAILAAHAAHWEANFEDHLKASDLHGLVSNKDKVATLAADMSRYRNLKVAYGRAADVDKQSDIGSKVTALRLDIQDRALQILESARFFCCGKDMELERYVKCMSEEQRDRYRSIASHLSPARTVNDGM